MYFADADADVMFLLLPQRLLQHLCLAYVHASASEPRRPWAYITKQFVQIKKKGNGRGGDCRKQQVGCGTARYIDVPHPHPHPRI